MTYSGGSKTRDLWFFCPVSACINHLHTNHNRDARANQRSVLATQLGSKPRIVSHTAKITSSLVSVKQTYCEFI